MRRKQGRGLGLCSPETVPETRTRDFLEGGPRDWVGEQKIESGKEKAPIDRYILNWLLPGSSVQPETLCGTVGRTSELILKGQEAGTLARVPYCMGLPSGLAPLFSPHFC